MINNPVPTLQPIYKCNINATINNDHNVQFFSPKINQLNQTAN